MKQEVWNPVVGLKETSRLWLGREQEVCGVNINISKWFDESWFSGEFIEIGRIIDSEHEESKHVQGKVSTPHVPQSLSYNDLPCYWGGVTSRQMADFTKTIFDSFVFLLAVKFRTFWRVLLLKANLFKFKFAF